ncbi:hypothetical protein [Nonomuraea sp. NPDC048826]|uniref:hypothetical protein n=1 Tax=Nonomuraea sp. NPDC048826 TaxID=3364347 RepID=UPI0037127353
MDESVQYYAIVTMLGPRDVANPGGLARRRVQADGTEVDEVLWRDLHWHSTNRIREWEMGEASGDLVEISEDQAAQVIAAFERKFGPKGR